MAANHFTSNLVLNVDVYITRGLVFTSPYMALMMMPLIPAARKPARVHPSILIAPLPLRTYRRVVQLEAAECHTIASALRTIVNNTKGLPPATTHLNGCLKKLVSIPYGSVDGSVRRTG